MELEHIKTDNIAIPLTYENIYLLTRLGYEAEVYGSEWGCDNNWIVFTPHRKDFTLDKDVDTNDFLDDDTTICDFVNGELVVREVNHKHPYGNEL